MKLFIENFLTQYGADIPLALLAGYLLDLLIGDPHGMWHPIRFIGNMVSFFEKGIRKIVPKTDGGEFVGGICLVVLVLVCATGIPLAVLALGYRIHRIVGLALQCYMCFTILATKSLKTESMKVYDALKNDGLKAGRRAVSMIVGRDTENLSEMGVTKAAVETIAENTSDGVIAPMIFLAIGGPVLGFFYKGVNTMDSMVGYKNEKYAHFGTAAARFDDIMNFLPSRIAAIFMILACALVPGKRLSKTEELGVVASVKTKNGEGVPTAVKTKSGDGMSTAVKKKNSEGVTKEELGSQKVNGIDLQDEASYIVHGNGEHAKERSNTQNFYIPSAKKAFRIWRRDRRKHASPNSAQTESVMAGALGVQLAGDAYYFGVKHLKPTIGDALRPVETEDIVRANRILYVTSVISLVVCFGVCVISRIG